MFRNKEVQLFTLIFMIIAVISMIAGFIISRAAGILIVLSATAFGTAFYVFTRYRYKRIAEISDRIDAVLHNADKVYISDEEEGELSILESEITKMTLRIREQNDALRNEKKHLADSLADIAHQLRTPLTSANLILSLLKKNPEENERRALLRETKELFSKMDWLITSLLKLSRLDAGIIAFNCEDTAVADLINAAFRPLQIPMELHNIDLQIQIPEGAVIKCDKGWLSEAVQNILKNSMESCGDNGRIEILCEDTLLYTEIKIHDNGAGFKKEDLPCLFDRFYRGKNTTTAGFGIGLALCRTIIIRLGGTITAKNHPHGGAVFTIRFLK